MKFNGLIPELSVRDFNISIHFYKELLGFKIEYERKESNFAFLSLGESQIMLEQINGNWETAELIYPFGRGINFQIEVEDVTEIYIKLKNNNYPIKIEMQENWYRADKKLFGSKEFLVMDPDGYLLRFAQSLGVRE